MMLNVWIVILWVTMQCTLNIEAAGFPQMQVTTCQTTLCHNLQDHDVNTDV